jgi:hypothetical protein
MNRQVGCGRCLWAHVPSGGLRQMFVGSYSIRWVMADACGLIFHQVGYGRCLWAHIPSGGLRQVFVGSYSIKWVTVDVCGLM